jgi:hypothetical protein
MIVIILLSSTTTPFISVTSVTYVRETNSNTAQQLHELVYHNNTMPAASDPNGWATTPPSVLVKVQDTSKEQLNGQTGVVLQYASDRARYTVQMAVSQDVVSLRAANLKKCSMYEQIQGQYQFMVHNPQIQQQIASVHGRVQAALPAAVKPEYLAIPVVVFIGGLFYLLGITRTLMLFSLVLVMGMIVGQDVMAPNASVRRVVQNAPMRFRAFLREQVPVVGNRIADNKYMTAAFAAIFLFFFVNAMTVSSSKRSASTSASGTGSGMFGSMFSSLTSSPPKTASLQHPPDFYYKLGFDDAVAKKPFGTSLPVEPIVVAAVPPPVLSDEWRIVDDDEDEFGSTRSATTGGQHAGGTRSSKKAASPWYTKVGSAMSFYYIYNAVKTLGEDPATAQWSWQRCLVAAKTMEPWRMGMLGLSVYKVVSLVFTG